MPGLGMSSPRTQTKLLHSRVRWEPSWPHTGKVGMFNVWLSSMKLAIWVPDSVSSAVATQRFNYDEVR